eukprot:403364361
MCTNYQNGNKCKKSTQDCMYAHGEEDLLHIPADLLLKIQEEVNRIRSEVQILQFPSSNKDSILMKQMGQTQDKFEEIKEALLALNINISANQIKNLYNRRNEEVKEQSVDQGIRKVFYVQQNGDTQQNEEQKNYPISTQSTLKYQKKGQKTEGSEESQNSTSLYQVKGSKPQRIVKNIAPQKKAANNQVTRQQEDLNLKEVDFNDEIQKIIYQELQHSIYIRYLASSNQLYDHFKTKFTGRIPYNKIQEHLPICFFKLQYNELKFGSVNFFINEPQSKNSHDAIYVMQQQLNNCRLCSQKACSIRELYINEKDQPKICKPIFEEIGGNKILLVDNQLKLQQALNILKEQDSIGIDIEGQDVVLLQIGCKDDVVLIFDIYSIYQNKKLYSTTHFVLNSLFMDESIRKVVFDGKGDVEALHFILETGVRNVFDIQVGHLIYTQLKQLKETKKHFQALGVKAASLNAVLEQFKTKRGVNTSKAQFKAVFKNPRKSQKLFYDRPLPQDFLDYAAQDVQDLNELADIITSKIHEISEEGVPSKYWETIIETASKAYCEFSCVKWDKIHSKY